MIDRLQSDQDIVKLHKMDRMQGNRHFNKQAEIRSNRHSPDIQHLKETIKEKKDMDNVTNMD